MQREHILLEANVEIMMANRAKQHAPSGSRLQFPPEADSDFDTVPVEQIEAWQEKLNERFGLGQGSLKVIEEAKRAV